MNGHFGCLEYAHMQGVSWSEKTTYAAAVGKGDDCPAILQWLIANGCPFNVMNAAMLYHREAVSVGMAQRNALKVVAQSHSPFESRRALISQSTEMKCIMTTMLHDSPLHPVSQPRCPPQLVVKAMRFELTQLAVTIRLARS